jgi:protein O-GlcNAc transferase
VLGVPPDAAAQLIREDRIDVLVDLTMHMADNRMLLFAQKPAPVQVTYLAYCSTTGLSAMDYRLTDPHLDPPGISDAYYSEASVRLPDTYWCYEPPQRSPDVNPTPAMNLGYVTFGCLNNFCKVSPMALQTWIQLMQRTANSQFILHTLEGSHRQRVREMFQSQDVDPRRLRFVGRIPFLEFLKLHQEIDIALDSFPYSGGTTTCDALWMGVPVISWGGQMGVARSGVSLLRNIGLPELIADSRQQYVEIAGDLAQNLPRLAELRRTMRGRMRESPLMDAARFARNVEGAYRQMWRTWCAAAK